MPHRPALMRFLLTIIVKPLVSGVILLDKHLSFKRGGIAWKMF